ncbi:MAG: hypothetical protein H6559_35645 [Lewinellaceae bacterium]|nr:hypothetical protein [Lewinellaceae bacterium]
MDSVTVPITSTVISATISGQAPVEAVREYVAVCSGLTSGSEFEKSVKLGSVDVQV